MSNEILNKNNEQKIVKAILKAYLHLNAITDEHSMQELSIKTQLPSPYGYNRNFYVKAGCMAFSDIPFKICAIKSYKYPVFKCDNITFSLHYNAKCTIKTKLPKYLKSHIYHTTDLQFDLFNQNEEVVSNVNNHYVIYYSGHHAAESIQLHSIVSKNDKLTSIFCQNLIIDKNLLLESEIIVSNPEFSLKADILQVTVTQQEKIAFNNELKKMFTVSYNKANKISTQYA